MVRTAVEEEAPWVAVRIERGCASQRWFDRPDVIQPVLVLMQIGVGR
jgi:hypothetical protein